MDRRTFAALLVGAISAPRPFWEPQAGAKAMTVFYSSVGGDLTLYSMDIDMTEEPEESVLACSAHLPQEPNPDVFSAPSYPPLQPAAFPLGTQNFFGILDEPSAGFATGQVRGGPCPPIRGRLQVEKADVEQHLNHNNHQPVFGTYTERHGPATEPSAEEIGMPSMTMGTLTDDPRPPPLHLAVGDAGADTRSRGQPVTPAEGPESMPPSAAEYWLSLYEDPTSLTGIGAWGADS